jgi:hypothetical protein
MNIAVSQKPFRCNNHFLNDIFPYKFREKFISSAKHNLVFYSFLSSDNVNGQFFAKTTSQLTHFSKWQIHRIKSTGTKKSWKNQKNPVSPQNDKCFSYGKFYRKIISPKSFDRTHFDPFDRTSFDRTPFDRKWSFDRKKFLTVIQPKAFFDKWSLDWKVIWPKFKLTERLYEKGHSTESFFWIFGQKACGKKIVSAQLEQMCFYENLVKFWNIQTSLNKIFLQPKFWKKIKFWWKNENLCFVQKILPFFRFFFLKNQEKA